MLGLTVLGIVLMALSLALLFTRKTVMRRVTTQPLGSLAPGFAATDAGYLLYAALVGVFGVFVMSVGIENVYLIVASIAVFVIGSIAGIAGEVVVYRNLKR